MSQTTKSSNILGLLKQYGMLDRDNAALTNRDASLRPTDIAALKAISQAAINVEEFTIPLYMASMYSLVGTHPITGNNKLYQGRLWPGKAPVSDPNAAEPNNQLNNVANNVVFNKIFKVFIEEMLHLQMAGNVANTIGLTPTFTSEELMTNDTYAWTCYGDNLTTIPHIVDLQDFKPEAGLEDVRVKLGAINDNSLKLFLAIEESDDLAKDNLKPTAQDKYFPSAPFANWQTGDPLPMFGSIGWMYACMWQYVELKYNDGTTLWDAVMQENSKQRDLFNAVTSGHPKKEYPGMNTEIPADASSQQAKLALLDMISGITDQGEGKTVSQIIRDQMGYNVLQAVEGKYQAPLDNLKEDYPSYSDKGEKVPSRDAYARSGHGNISLDHFEVFSEAMDIYKNGYQGSHIQTWDQWHESNSWTAEYLTGAPGDWDSNPYKDNMPAPDVVSAAMNRLKDNDADGSNYQRMCQAAAGAIKGITTVLNDYWTKDGVLFPYPSMGGSGDRMSICWAVFGKVPDLSIGTPSKQHAPQGDPYYIYNACQGIVLDDRLPHDPNDCANVAVYHTCKGSNTCRAEGGCGFVSTVDGGSGCSQTAVAHQGKFNLSGTNKTAIVSPETVKANGGGCGPIPWSATSNNKCAGAGGCAVPISASQLWTPHVRQEYSGGGFDPEYMDVQDVLNRDSSDPFVLTFDTIKYYPAYDVPDSPWQEGKAVYDLAWDAYKKVLAKNNQPDPGDPPPPSDFRLAFPPST